MCDLTTIVTWDPDKGTFCGHVANETDKNLLDQWVRGKIQKTHKRVTNEEFWTLPKLFIDDQRIIVVISDQTMVGGYAYIEHCNSHDYWIDRKNNVIVLTPKQTQEG